MSWPEAFDTVAGVATWQDLKINELVAALIECAKRLSETERSAFRATLRGATAAMFDRAWAAYDGSRGAE